MTFITIMQLFFSTSITGTQCLPNERSRVTSAKDFLRSRSLARRMPQKERTAMVVMIMMKGKSY
jgi:hypothetical protein